MAIARDSVLYTERGPLRPRDIQPMDRVWDGGYWQNVKLYDSYSNERLSIPAHEVLLSNGQALKLSLCQKVFVRRAPNSEVELRTVEEAEGCYLVESSPDLGSVNPRDNVEAMVYGLLTQRQKGTELRIHNNPYVSQLLGLDRDELKHLDTIPFQIPEDMVTDKTNFDYFSKGASPGCISSFLFGLLHNWLYITSEEVWASKNSEGSPNAASCRSFQGYRARLTNTCLKLRFYTPSWRNNNSPTRVAQLFRYLGISISVKIKGPYTTLTIPTSEYMKLMRVVDISDLDLKLTLIDRYREWQKAGDPAAHTYIKKVAKNPASESVCVAISGSNKFVCDGYLFHTSDLSASVYPAPNLLYVRPVSDMPKALRPRKEAG